MDRRTFTALAITGAPLLRAQEGPSVKLDQWLASLAAEAWTQRRKRIAALGNPRDVRARQKFVREWMERAIGGLPQKTPLNPRITGTLERDGYRVENLIYESLPKFPVTANLYVPSSGKGPFPALLGVAGHSDTGKAVDTYQHVWISMAKLGFMVLAFDPAGQGERLEYWNRQTRKSDVGTGVREHIMAGLQCLLTGTTFARYEIWDGIRAVDYLLTRSDVDPKRIGVAGNSGGGTQTAYLAVLEPRLSCAVSSCYITSWETMWEKPGPQDAEQVFPGFLSDGLDFGDFPLAFAPRPFQISAAVQDFFPIAGARATHAEAKRVYEAADAPGRAGYFEFDDGHGWSLPRREATYQWMSRWLQAREDAPKEPQHTVEPPNNLNVTPTGQIHDEDGWETVRSLNVARAEALSSKRAAVHTNASELRELIRKRLAIRQSGRPQVRTAADGIFLTTEGGVELHGILHGTGNPGRSPAVLTIDWLDYPKRSDEAVFVFEPRGFGATAIKADGRGYSPEYARAMRAILLGRTMLGMAVGDVLAAYEYLRSRDDIDQARIRIAGREHGGLVAQIAAALEPRISAVQSAGALTSWLELARMRTHSGMVNAIVPNVLADFDVPDLHKLIRPRPLEL
ncbi:MAG TPA: acetylxylan esterase [Bryobacteraceae bacterium]|nr:acetylxylan esterase [Bryobacteraceae bacterium]